VLRPEIIIPEPGEPIVEEVVHEGALEVGRTVRLIRDPYFGKLATVTELPPEPQVIETEAKVRVVRVRLAEGQEVVVPRANVELIEQ
jgi:transcription antitermination factor NusG